MSLELARKLKKARAKLGLSQRAAAAEWCVSVKTLQSWEADRYTPKGLALKLLMEKLNRILSE
jgi:DNA-binding transcriptional regulator YiaG